ncbi:hypothetical protein TNCV_2181301 [Trichonephila clavipes]|uniref:Uncharacterized protein n=1 Tax=Trichonephila clavipes TaxID=2585209 RepID=A0A8X6VUV5_TRICX|nr:hypothetical protein TNCV_2181301 [Trichonephila clavipes]
MTCSKPLLLALNSNRHLRFIKKHKDWIADDWKWVIRSDELRLKSHPRDDRLQIWRKWKENTNPIYIATTLQDCDYRTSAKSDPVDDETHEDEDNYNESSKCSSNAGGFSALETAMEWYEQQSAVLLNCCCPRESETKQRKNEGVEWYSENKSDNFSQ